MNFTEYFIDNATITNVTSFVYNVKEEDQILLISVEGCTINLPIGTNNRILIIKDILTYTLTKQHTIKARKNDTICGNKEAYISSARGCLRLKFKTGKGWCIYDNFTGAGKLMLRQNYPCVKNIVFDETVLQSGNFTNTFEITDKIIYSGKNISAEIIINAEANVLINKKNYDLKNFVTKLEKGDIIEVLIDKPVETSVMTIIEKM
jgi:hypothetical protein